MSGAVQLTGADDDSPEMTALRASAGGWRGRRTSHDIEPAGRRSPVRQVAPTDSAAAIHLRRARSAFKAMDAGKLATLRMIAAGVPRHNIGGRRIGKRVRPIRKLADVWVAARVPDAGGPADASR